MKEKVFSNVQILDIVEKYNNGSTLKSIAEMYKVSRPIIQKVLLQHNATYTGKKRRSEEFATEATTKVCSVCKRILLLSAFSKGNCKFGVSSRCKECDRKIQNDPERKLRRNQLRKLRRENLLYRQRMYEKDTNTRHNNEESLKKAILRSAKRRAKMRNLEFNLTIKDFEIPKTCPLLGIPLKSEYGMSSDNSYSLDRIDSSKGYVKGNVWIISRRANMIKNNATIEELELIVKNLRYHWVH